MLNVNHRRLNDLPRARALETIGISILEISNPSELLREVGPLLLYRDGPQHEFVATGSLSRSLRVYQPQGQLGSRIGLGELDRLQNGQTLSIV